MTAMPRTLKQTFALAITVMLASCTHSIRPGDGQSVLALVLATERAFAATMAERDFEAFAAYIDPEAVFIETPEPLQGKTAILDGWRGYFSTPAAPFTWDPDQVIVLESGNLAHSSGLVYNTRGEPVGRFNSIWRLNANGDWKIVFDKGSPLED